MPGQETSGVFHSLRKITALFKHIDFKEVLSLLSNVDEVEFYKMIKSLKSRSQDKDIPEVQGDFYYLAELLTADERAIQARVREFMQEEVQPIVNDFWLRGEFPHQIIPKLAALNICGLTYQGYGCAHQSSVLEGMVTMEMARVDASISTFLGVQSGLAMGSIYYCGSKEQKEKWLPGMRSMELIGAFGLTEPEVGSAVAGGLTTTAKREGDKWVLNGQKKWIGNATFADITIIWARDEEDQKVKGFIVEKGTPGFTTEKQEDKMALRIVQNAIITLKDCKISEENRLQEASGFRDTAKVLRMTRAGVAWQAVGCARGAYENALKYTTKRKQFGKPIAGFQLVQDQLVQMLSNLTAMQNMVFRLSQLQDSGKMTDEQASLAKVFCTMRTRDIVEQARALLGGNGILLSYDVARFVADAEALYTYEGTKEINSLVVGRAITGQSAFI